MTPAYDLTYSESIGGEHATCVNGNGWNPDMEDLLAVGKATGISTRKLRKIALEIENINIYDRQIIFDWVKEPQQVIVD